MTTTNRKGNKLYVYIFSRVGFNGKKIYEFVYDFFLLVLLINTINITKTYLYQIYMRITFSLLQSILSNKKQ